MGALEQLLSDMDDTDEVVTRLLALALVAQVHERTGASGWTLIQDAKRLVDYIENGND